MHINVNKRCNMAYETLQLFIDGKWTDGTSGITENVINPATEEVLGKLPHASQADLDAALAAADRGFKVWLSLIHISEPTRPY